MEGKQKEFEFILEFIESSDDLDQVLVMCQLRSLWTSLCIRHNMVVDTGDYDDKMQKLWAAMEDNLNNPFSSDEYERFYNAMSKYLI